MNPEGLSKAKHSHLEIFEPSAILLNNHVLVCLSLIMNVSFCFWLKIFFYIIKSEKVKTLNFKLVVKIILIKGK